MCALNFGIRWTVLKPGRQNFCLSLLAMSVPAESAQPTYNILKLDGCFKGKLERDGHLSLTKMSFTALNFKIPYKKNQILAVCTHLLPIGFAFC